MADCMLNGTLCCMLCLYTFISWMMIQNSSKVYLIKNSQAVKKGAAPKKAMVKKDVKSKVAAKKWL